MTSRQLHMTGFLQDSTLLLCNAVAKQGGSITCSHSAGAGLGCPGGLSAAGNRVPAGYTLQVAPYPLGALECFLRPAQTFEPLF